MKNFILKAIRKKNSGKWTQLFGLWPLGPLYSLVKFHMDGVFRSPRNLSGSLIKY